MKITSIEFVKGVVATTGFPRDELPEVAFLGRSNVGKSSLINLVTGRRNLARTSKTPGKTREINYFRINDRFYLVDLPGYGYAKVARSKRAGWAHLIVHILQQRPALKLIVHLIDGRHAPSDLDREAMALCAASSARYLVVVTKADKPSQRERADSQRAIVAALTALGLDPPIVVSSAAARQGAAAILAHIAAAVDGEEVPAAPVVAARRRHAHVPPDDGGGDVGVAADHSGTSTTVEASTQPGSSTPPDSASRSQRPRRST